MIYCAWHENEQYNRCGVRRCGLRPLSCMNAPRSGSLLLCFLLLAVLSTSVFAAPAHGPDALFAVLDSGVQTDAPALLAAFGDGHPVLRQCNANGIAYAVPYYLLKGRMAAQAGNIAVALRELRRADGVLVWCQAPTNAALSAEFHRLFSHYAALIYLDAARHSRAIGKHLTAEHYARRVLALPHTDDDARAQASLELAQLYRAQGRVALAYTVCTALHARAQVLPKEAFVVKADTAFCLGKHREAFTDLLTVLFTDGIQSARPHDDPALTLFLRRIGRATPEEILAFHDALGIQLEREELTAGKEPLLALLIQQRLLLAKVFPFVAETTKKDVAALEQRIAQSQQLKDARDTARQRLEAEKAGRQE